MHPIGGLSVILSHIYSMIRFIYNRLNNIEKGLLPSVGVGYKSLFNSLGSDHLQFKTFILILIVLTLVLNVLEGKNKFATSPIRALEPIGKMAFWSILLGNLGTNLDPNLLNFVHHGLPIF